MWTDAGAVAVALSRDRDATFELQLVPKRQRRLEGFNELICGLVCRGMTTRDVQAQVREVYGWTSAPSWCPG